MAYGIPCETIPFTFAIFPPRRGAKRNGPGHDIDGALPGLERRKLRAPRLWKWRHKPLTSLETDSRMAISRLGSRQLKENRSGELRLGSVSGV